MRELNAKQNSTCRAEGLVLRREMLTETQTPGSRSCASLGTAVATALGCAMRNLQQREREKRLCHHGGSSHADLK